MKIDKRALKENKTAMFLITLLFVIFAAIIYTTSEQFYKNKVTEERAALKTKLYIAQEAAINYFNNVHVTKETLERNLKKLITLMPRGTYLASPNKSILFSQNSALILSPTSIELPVPAGKVYATDNKMVIYSTIPISRTIKLTIIAYYNALPLRKVFWQMIASATSTLAVVLFLMLMISYIYILRYRKAIVAERAIIYSLAELAENRDPGTGQHLKRTTKYANILAKSLHKNRKYRRIIDEYFLEDLANAAPLHDIGKVGIQDAVLLKEDKLTDEEFGEIKQHVKIGSNLMQNIIDKFNLKESFIVMARNICAFHHERYSGGGYNNLAGEQIPLEARLFAVCDTYDAIRTKRPYKEELSHEEAIKRIKEERGKQFDPDVVDAFLDCEQEFLRFSKTII